MGPARARVDAMRRPSLGPRAGDSRRTSALKRVGPHRDKGTAKVSRQVARFCKRIANALQAGRHPRPHTMKAGRGHPSPSQVSCSTGACPSMACPAWREFHASRKRCSASRARRRPRSTWLPSRCPSRCPLGTAGAAEDRPADRPALDAPRLGSARTGHAGAVLARRALLPCRVEGPQSGQRRHRLAGRPGHQRRLQRGA